MNFQYGFSEEEFKKDEKTYYAVIRRIEIIGEAAKRIPEQIVEKHPDVPWKDMAKMRDKVIHSYTGGDIKKIMLVVNEDIPKIMPLLQTTARSVSGNPHSQF